MKYCLETNEKLKDKEKVERGRRGGRKCQQNIRTLKDNFKQQKLDLTLFMVKDKLVTHAVEHMRK